MPACSTRKSPPPMPGCEPPSTTATTSSSVDAASATSSSAASDRPASRPGMAIAEHVASPTAQPASSCRRRRSAAPARCQPRRGLPALPGAERIAADPAYGTRRLLLRTRHRRRDPRRFDPTDPACRLDGLRRRTRAMKDAARASSAARRSSLCGAASRLAPRFAAPRRRASEGRRGTPTSSPPRRHHRRGPAGLSAASRWPPRAGAGLGSRPRTTTGGSPGTATTSATASATCAPSSAARPTPAGSPTSRNGRGRILTRAMVTAINPDHSLDVTTPAGLQRITAAALVLATGARNARVRRG